MTEVIIRTQTIHLPVSATRAQIECIMNDLNHEDAVTALSLDGSALTLHYHFPRFVFRKAWLIINQHIENPVPGVIARLKYTLLAWKEDNESEHLRSHTGWHRYIQDIYVEHFRQQHSVSSHTKKQWQNNQAAAKITTQADN
jgi:hypothetical protein